MLSFADVQAWSWRLFRVAVAVCVAAMALGIVFNPLRRVVPEASFTRFFRGSNPSSLAGWQSIHELPDLEDAEVEVDLTVSERDVAGSIRVTMTRARLSALQRLMGTLDRATSGVDWHNVAYEYAGYVFAGDAEELDIDVLAFDLPAGTQNGSLYLRLRRHALPQDVARPLVMFEPPATIKNPRVTVRLHTRRVQIVAVNVPPSAQSADETVAVTWPRGQRIDFAVLRSALPTSGEAAPRRRIDEVMSLFQSTSLRVVDPLVTAVMQSLPFLLLIALRRRVQRAEAWMAEGLTATTAFAVLLLGLGVVQAALDLYFTGPANRLQGILSGCRESLFNAGGAAAIGAMFVAWYWPVAVGRSRHRIGTEPASIRSRIVLWTVLVEATAVTVSATAFGCAGRPLPTVVLIFAALATTVLAIATASAELMGTRRALLDGVAITFGACVLEAINTALNPPNLAAFALVALLTIPLVYSVLRLLLPDATRRALLGGAIILCATLVAGPLPNYNLWWQATVPSMASALAPAIRLLAALFLLRLLRETSRRGWWSVLEPVERNAGVVLALTFFVLPTHRWLYSVIALAVAWLLFTRWVFVPRQLGATIDDDVLATIHDVIRLNESEVALRAMKKELRAKLAKSEIELADYERRVGSLEALVQDRRDRLRPGDNTAPAAVLSSGQRMEPWQRAMVGTKYGLLFAIPWLALLLRDFHAGFAPDRGYAWLAAIGTAVQAMGQWPLLGFFFGYFYPHLRGENGISKGLYLFLAVVAPMFAATTLAMPTNPEAWTSFSFWALQLFIHCMLLGVFAGDYETLRASGLEWQHLVDVHNLGALTAWGSSLLIAVGAAATTAATSQAGALIMQALKVVAPELKTPQ